jgi:hypothetical protein
MDSRIFPVRVRFSAEEKLIHLGGLRGSMFCAFSRDGETRSGKYGSNEIRPLDAMDLFIHPRSFPPWLGDGGFGVGRHRYGVASGKPVSVNSMGCLRVEPGSSHNAKGCW